LLLVSCGAAFGGRGEQIFTVFLSAKICVAQHQRHLRSILFEMPYFQFKVSCFSKIFLSLHKKTYDSSHRQLGTHWQCFGSTVG
jgi:hypothetical protein